MIRVFPKQVIIGALSVLFWCGVAYANPVGGMVVGGSANIVDNGTKVDVYQHTNRAVIDWRSFDIAAGEHTEFHQPSTSAVAVNRISDLNPSHIAGKLSANGNIVLVNPNGFLFSNTATVDVNGIVASTADIDTTAFMVGSNDFNIAGNSNAQIINEGVITASQAGLAGFVAPHVLNNGVITAKVVQLSSADTFGLDLYGDGLLAIAVSDAVTTQLVKNTGTITAEQTVALTAATGRELLEQLVRVEGEVKTLDVANNNGTIIISAGHGRAEVAGDITSAGGYVEVTGDKVGLMADSSINTSSATSGGEVLVGGDFQGNGTLQNAVVTYVDEAAIINANATENGDGGRVIIWADDTTRFAGSINANGGAQSGDGGFVEVSGKKHLDFRGTVDTTAANGENGELLLDPTDIVISAAADLNVTAATPFEPNLDDGPSNLDVATLNNALLTTTVTVQTIATGTQNGDIIVNAPITWSSFQTLNLIAANKIFVNSPISFSKALTLTAADVDINAAISRSISIARLSLIPNISLATVGIAGGVGTFNLPVADLDFIQAGILSTTIGLSSLTAVMDVGAYTWPTTAILDAGAGEMQINGTQNMGANSLSLLSRNLSINNDLIGTGNLTIRPANVSTSIGVAGGVGTLNISNTELDHIINGWNLINFGSAVSHDVTVNARTWQDSVSFQTTNGSVVVNGVQNVGSNDLTLIGDVNINADLIGTGDIRIRPNGNGSIGIAGGAGSTNINNTELAHIIDGWNLIAFGRSGTGLLTANAYTWQDSVEFTTFSGTLNIAGMQTFGSNNITLISDALSLNADLVGTGIATIGATSNQSIGIAGGAGTSQITTADIARFIGGWSKLNIGHLSGNVTSNAGSIDVGTLTMPLDLEIRTGQVPITFSGQLDMGSNNLTIRGSGDIIINAPLVGTGILSFEAGIASRTIGIAGGAGDVAISSADLDQIATGWSEVSFGSTVGTGTMSVNAYAWRWPTFFESSTGAINFLQAQDFQANDLHIRTNSNLALTNNLVGTGNLIVDTQTVGTTIGLAGGGGSLNLTSGELGFIQNGWNSLTFGRADSTAAMSIGAYNWNDDLTLLAGSSTITTVGAQTLLGGSSLTINSDLLSINANLIGTGELVLSTENTTTTVGLAGGAGTFNLTSTELDYIADGWNSITIGRADSTATTALNAYANWRDNVTLLSNTGVTSIFGNQTTVGATTSLTFDTPTLLTASRNIATVGGNISFLKNIDGGAFNLDIDAVAGNVVLNTVANTNDLTIAGANLTFNNTVNVANNLLADMTGDITVNNTIAALGATNALVLSGVDFFNTAGAAALTATNSRWLVYSTDPTANTRDDLLPNFSDFGKTFVGNPPATIAAGNALIYSIAAGAAPTLTYKVDDKTIAFDDALGALSLSFVNGLTGSDTLLNIGLAGAANLSSTYVAGDPAGDYIGSLTASIGTLTTAFGYQFAFQAGNLTVTAPAVPAISSGTLPNTFAIVSQIPEIQAVFKAENNPVRAFAKATKSFPRKKVTKKGVATNGEVEDVVEIEGGDSYAPKSNGRIMIDPFLRKLFKLDFLEV